MYFITRFLSLAAFILVSATASQAQDKSDTTQETVAIAVPVAADTGPEDALNRGTPRSSAIGFLKACADFDF